MTETLLNSKYFNNLNSTRSYISKIIAKKSFYNKQNKNLEISKLNITSIQPFININDRKLKLKLNLEFALV